ncbi:MAG: AraC family transcriptional regulator [Flavobacteriaceae bacterium]|nr:AraC family transcriptional regulator [Flavobacteriaceae bacterium]
MDITLNIGSIIDLLSFSTAFMLGCLFLFKPPKATIFLGLFMLSLSLEILGALSNNLAESNTIDLFIPMDTVYVTLVFLLIYIKKIVNLNIKKIEWFLFLPGILINILFWLGFFFKESLLLSLFEYSFNVAIILYLFKILKEHLKSITEFYSEIEQKTLSWINTILIVFLFFNILWFVEDLVGLFNGNLPEIFSIVSTIITFLLVYWIGYKGISQPENFKETHFRKKVPPITKTNFSPEVNSDDEFVFKTIYNRIQEEKLFVNKDLNLRTLAIVLETKEKELSRLINTCSKTNFYHFINEFRVAKFKELLTSPKAKQLSILGLAEEAGFSSKSTFYTAFKKVEGITPKQYELMMKKSE